MAISAVGAATEHSTRKDVSLPRGATEHASWEGAAFANIGLPATAIKTEKKWDSETSTKASEAIHGPAEVGLF